MFTFRKAFVALTALAASFAATTLPAAAAEYPEPDEYQLVLDVAHCKIGGTELRIHARATSGGEDISGTMEITALGETYDDDDNDLTVNVTTPVVTKKTKFTVTATFEPDDNADAAAASQSSNQVTQASYSSAALPTAFDTKTTSETFTLVPRSVGCSDDDGDSDNGGLLPDTGGISPWFLILGALLLATGAGVLTAVRRRTKNFV